MKYCWPYNSNDINNLLISIIMGSAKEGVVYTGSLPYSWPLIVVLSEFLTLSCYVEDFIHLSVVMVVLKSII